jgi:hypothetical protein
MIYYKMFQSQYTEIHARINAYSGRDGKRLILVQIAEELSPFDLIAFRQAAS